MQYTDLCLPRPPYNQNNHRRLYPNLEDYNYTHTLPGCSIDHYRDQLCDHQLAD